MRLFQSTVTVGEIPPPPPFLCPPDPSRDQLRYMNYSLMKKDKRLPTPEKVAIMELSSSFERHRLGKQQQLLTDISRRCREQEVADLSSKLTKKCSLASSENRGREVTFYSTTFMHKRQKTFAGFPEEPIGGVSSENESPASPRPTVEKSYKFFPARKMIKQHSRYEFQRRSLIKSRPQQMETSPPQYNSSVVVQPQYQEVYNPTKVPRLNSTMQMDHFFRNKYDSLAPLVLSNSLSENKLDSIVTARVNLGARQRTNPAWGEAKSNGTTATTNSTRSYKSSSRSLKPLKTLKDSASFQPGLEETLPSTEPTIN